MVNAIIIRNGKLLTLYNIKHGERRIEPPGGKKHHEETAEQCLLREVDEEIGVMVEVGRPFGKFTTITPEGPFNIYSYLAKIIGGEPYNKEPGKHEKIAWHTMEELREFAQQGLLVPNLIEALDKLEEHMG